jgi:hypothetical protein
MRLQERGPPELSLRSGHSGFSHACKMTKELALYSVHLFLALPKYRKDEEYKDDIETSSLNVILK